MKIEKVIQGENTYFIVTNHECDTTAILKEINDGIGISDLYHYQFYYRGSLLKTPHDILARYLIEKNSLRSMRELWDCKDVAETVILIKNKEEILAISFCFSQAGLCARPIKEVKDFLLMPFEIVVIPTGRGEIKNE